MRVIHGVEEAVREAALQRDRYALVGAVDLKLKVLNRAPAGIRCNPVRQRRRAVIGLIDVVLHAEVRSLRPHIRHFEGGGETDLAFDGEVPALQALRRRMQLIAGNGEAGDVAGEGGRRGERVGQGQRCWIGGAAVPVLRDGKREGVGQRGPDPVLDIAAVENAVSTANHSLVSTKRPPGKAEPRCEGPIPRIHQRCRQSRLGGRRDQVGIRETNTGSGQRGLVGDHHLVQ